MASSERNLDENFESDEGSDDDLWEACDEDALEQEQSSVCLFCSEILPSVNKVFEHCLELHKYDIVSHVQKSQMDCFGYIKFINFIREQKPEVDVLKEIIESRQEPWNADQYMMPVIEDDPLLQFDIEELPSIETCDLGEPTAVGDRLSNTSGADYVTLTKTEITSLLHRVQVAEERAKAAEDKLRCAVEDLEKMRSAAGTFLMSQQAEPVPNDKAVAALTEDEDDVYFGSYGHFSIHEEMLKDKVRTESYRDAILLNKAMFEGKVVLDIGCGTGILSMFAAQAGAKKVIGVDQSDVIYQAMDIVRENGLSDKITLLKGRMEDVELPVDQVDIIVSEWMGYFLLFESMLDTVLWARDRYLSPGGYLLPDTCSISLVGLNDPDMHHAHCGYWQDVYGYKMSCMRKAVVKEASVAVVKADRMATSHCVIKDLDLLSCQVRDLEFTSPFVLTAQEDTQLTALVGYFHIGFSKLPEQVSFSTSPAHTATHWKQTVFLLEQPVQLNKDECLDGQLICKKNRKDPRSLIVTISLRGKVFSYLMQ